VRRPALADQTEVTGPDLRLVVPAGAAWLGSLWGLTHDASAAVTSLSLLLVGTAAFAVLGGARARTRLRSASAVRLVALSACIGAAGTVLAAGLRIGALEDGPVVRLAHQGAAGEVELVVTSDPRPVRSRVVGNTRAPTEYAVPADLVSLRIGAGEVRQQLPVLVIGAGSAWSELLPGQPLRVAARLEPADPSGGDDVAVVLSARGPPTLTGRPSLVQRVAGQVRASMRRSVASLAPPERGLVAGLVDGDTSQLPEQTADDFRAAGLTHLVAVSGVNAY
jgi:competence protein ComEC